MKRSIQDITAAALLREALDHQADVFDHEDEVNGGDLVEWFGEWRERVRQFMEGQ